MRPSIAWTIVFWLYGAGMELVTWLGIVPWTCVRAPRGHARAAVSERLGRVAAFGPDLVIHAVSLGELRAAEGLIHLLGDVRVLLTVGTPDARQQAAHLAGRDARIVGVQYLPADRPRAMRRWLRACAPGRVVLIESELWPGLLMACRTEGRPVSVASARIYPRDVWRYRAIGWFMRPVLNSIDRYHAQSVEERDRLTAIGVEPARVTVTGDLKAIAALGRRGTAASVAPVGTLVVLGACTHAPEEALLLDALTRVRRQHPAARLILAPRDCGRAATIALLCRAAGLSATTAGDNAASWDVLVVDQPGGLAALYGQATVAVIGGTLAPVGGHSLLEAAAAGVPILVGPSVRHVAAQVRACERGGGLVRVTPDAAALAHRLGELLADPELRAALSTSARAACERMAAEASWFSLTG